MLTHIRAFHFARPLPAIRTYATYSVNERPLSSGADGHREPRPAYDPEPGKKSFGEPDNRKSLMYGVGGGVLLLAGWKMMTSGGDSRKEYEKAKHGFKEQPGPTHYSVVPSLALFRFADPSAAPSRAYSASSDPRNPHSDLRDKAQREKDMVVKLGAAGVLGLVGWWWYVQRKEMAHPHSQEVAKKPTTFSNGNERK
ncbi:hypothetical protein JCM8097_008524 [Rhodosporidiobolus ruineniae]